MDNLETRIRTAYAALAVEPRAWVALARLRNALSDVPKADFDATLKTMSRESNLDLVPEENQKILTAADHTAAVRHGGQDKHLLSIWG